jgi:hypothetical protein
MKGVKKEGTKREYLLWYERKADIFNEEHMILFYGRA